MSRGLDDDRVAALLALAEDEVTSGRLPSCQLALAVDGAVAVRATFGADEAAVYTTFSVTKGLFAAAVWLLLGQGLEPEQPVAELLPELDGRITVEHLLTHTAGFPRAPLRPEEGATSEGRRARFATWRLDWEPGSRTEYHPASAHWVLAELVEQVSGTDFRRFVRDRVLDPLGLPAMRLGLGAGDVLVEPVVTVGTAVPRDDVPEVASAASLMRFNEPVVRAVGVPGAGAVSTADDVALLYQALLHDPKGLWDPAVLADGTGTVRNAMTDPWIGVPALRTLGLSVAGDDGHGALRQFGKATGPRAFGASGVGGQMAWGDPDSGLSFCFLTGGVDADQVAAFVRSTRLSTAAARCARVSP